jgi:hypothetical protein
MSRTFSCAPIERVESSPVLVFDEKDVTTLVATEVEGEHRRNKRNREVDDLAEQEVIVGEGGGAPVEEAVATQIFGRNSAVRRLEYNDNEDVLGAIAQLPDDGKVEQEPQMTQAWNQDTESPVPLTQPLSEAVEESSQGNDELEEGEIPPSHSSKPIKAG